MPNYTVYNVIPSVQGGKPIKAWVKGVPVEEQALEQLHQVASMPFIYKHIAVMPDVHWGMGTTIGSVIPTQGAIIPAAVGVDIGCGMAAVQTDLMARDLPDNLKGIRTAIEKAVPHGRTNKGNRDLDRGAWGSIPREVFEAWIPLQERFDRITLKDPLIAKSNSVHHLGTLGTGNHFIEVCLDESDQVWFMLHSGSRGVGNKIGMYFINKAKEDMRKWMINLPEKDLAYLPEGTEHFDDYLDAVGWAQDFAKINRDLMMRAVIKAVGTELGVPITTDRSAVNCHHNYVTREHHFGQNILITRKGAVRAREGDLGIIPGSMGAKSFIVRGKGNRESFHSCSHGAGRKMSRTVARKTFTVDDHARDTAGVECRKDKDVVDETPKAYKDIDTVMKAQEDLVDIVHTLKQVVCVKG